MSHDETPHVHSGEIEIEIPKVVLQVASLLASAACVGYFVWLLVQEKRNRAQWAMSDATLRKVAEDFKNSKHEVVVAVAPPIGDPEL